MNILVIQTKIDLRESNRLLWTAVVRNKSVIRHHIFTIDVGTSWNLTWEVTSDGHTEEIEKGYRNDEEDGCDKQNWAVSSLVEGVKDILVASIQIVTRDVVDNWEDNL